MNLIGVFVTKLWPVQAAGGGNGGGDGGATKNIISPKFSNFGIKYTNKTAIDESDHVLTKRGEAYRYRCTRLRCPRLDCPPAC